MEFEESIEEFGRPELMGLAYSLESERFDRAMGFLNKLLADEPNEGRWHSCLAYIHLKKNEIFQAQNVAEEAIGLNPDDDMCYYILSCVFFCQKDYSRSRRNINQALEINPEKPLYHAVSASLFLKKKFYKQAKVTAEVGLKLNPEDFHCLSKRAQALIMLNRSKEAGKVIKQMLIINPNRYECHFCQALLYMKKVDLKNMESKLFDALACDPNNEEALGLLGSVPLLKKVKLLDRMKFIIISVLPIYLILSFFEIVPIEGVFILFVVIFFMALGLKPVFNLWLKNLVKTRR